MVTQLVHMFPVIYGMQKVISSLCKSSSLVLMMNKTNPVLMPYFSRIF